MIRVIDLIVGDVVKFNNNVDVVVVEILKNRVSVKKTTSPSKIGLVSIDFYSPNFDDCFNRVELVPKSNLILEALQNKYPDAETMQQNPRSNNDN